MHADNQVFIHNYLFDDKIKSMKEMIGLELFQILSFNLTNFQSICQPGKYTSYNFNNSIKLHLRNKKRSQVWDVYVKSYPDTLYGDIHGISLKCNKMQQETILYHNMEVSKYASNSCIIQIKETIEYIEIYGVKTTLLRDREIESEHSKIKVNVNVDQLILFHFESGIKGAICGGGVKDGTYLSFYSKDNLEELNNWIEQKENQFGEKMYNLKHTISY